MTTQGSPEPSWYSVPSNHKNTHQLTVRATLVSVAVGKTNTMSLMQSHSGEAGLSVAGLPEIITVCFVSELAHSFYNAEASSILILS